MLTENGPKKKNHPVNGSSSGCWMDLWIVDAGLHRSIARLFQGDREVPET